MSTDSSREDIPRVHFDSLIAWQRVKNDYRAKAIENVHKRARARGLKGADKVVVDEMNDVNRNPAYHSAITII